VGWGGDAGALCKVWTCEVYILRSTGRGEIGSARSEGPHAFIVERVGRPSPARIIRKMVSISGTGSISVDVEWRANHPVI